MIQRAIAQEFSINEVMAIPESPSKILRIETKNTLDCTYNGQEITDPTAIFDSGVFKNSQIMD